MVIAMARVDASARDVFVLKPGDSPLTAVRDPTRKTPPQDAAHAGERPRTRLWIGLPVSYSRVAAALILSLAHLPKGDRDKMQRYARHALVCNYVARDCHTL